eukprot:527625-Prymnesium_polylepis.1
MYSLTEKAAKDKCSKYDRRTLEGTRPGVHHSALPRHLCSWAALLDRERSLIELLRLERVVPSREIHPLDCRAGAHLEMVGCETLRDVGAPSRQSTIQIEG